MVDSKLSNQEFIKSIDKKFLDIDIYPPELNNCLKKGKPRIILILGGPGSGKGTQSKYLCQEFEIIHISIGDVLRDLKNQKTEMGEVANFWTNEFEKTGRLMPLEITFRILLDTFVEKGWTEKPFLVDGFIKDFSILKKWDKYMEPILDVKLAIYYDVQLDTMRSRVNKRSKEENRGDEDVIEKRIECFLKRTIPAVEMIRKKGYLITINGEQKMETIREETRVAYLKAMFSE